MEFRISRWVDRIVLAAALFIVLAIYFSMQFSNVSWGLAAALPMTAMLCYAFSLWNRRGAGARAKRENAKWCLHNLMLMPYEQALTMSVHIIAKQYGMADVRFAGDHALGTLEGRETSLHVLQRPLDSRTGSDAVLTAYHAASRKYLILVSTAPYTSDAAVFARQLRDPYIALLGPENLLPLLGEYPRDDEAHKKDKRKRRYATFAELRARAAHPDRTRRYLMYGMAMLVVYILLDLWPFLIPGLACIFLAVISRRQHRKVKKLFEDEDDT